MGSRKWVVGRDGKSNNRHRNGLGQTRNQTNVFYNCFRFLLVILDFGAWISESGFFPC